MRERFRWILAVALGCAFAAFAACTNRDSSAPKLLVGAGASLPYPLYARWSAEYAKLDPKVRISYQAVGSGAGVRQVTDGVVDFGATDEPVREAELARAKADVVHVPTTVGAVAITYNLGDAAPLTLTPELVADVFLGALTRWDDPRLLAVNAGRALPAETITVVHRADGSGTSAAFTSYLSRTSEAWRAKVGAGTTPRFPVGVGVKGNQGVAAHVKQTPFTIGYVEVAHAHLAGLPVASVLDQSGDAGAYPIVAVSYVVLPREARDPVRGAALAQFLWWAVHDGQRHARGLEYGELPPDLVRRAEAALRELRAGDKPLLPAGG